MEPKNMTDSPNPQEQAVRLLCFMVSSARGLLDEPKLYGPRRLVDATEQLLSLLEQAGIYDRSWDELKEFIHSNRGHMQRDAEHAREFLDSLMELAVELLLET